MKKHQFYYHKEKEQFILKHEMTVHKMRSEVMK